MTDIERLTAEFAALNVVVMALLHRDPDRAALLAVLDSITRDYRALAASDSDSLPLPAESLALLQAHRSMLGAKDSIAGDTPAA